MKKTLIWFVVLVGVVQLQRLEAQAPAAPTPQPAAAEQPKPVEDPLGRSTPKGTVVGLVTAAKQGNLERAADYLQSTLAPSERQALAEKLRVVLDRKLLTTFDGVSDKPDGDLADGLTNRDQVGDYFVGRNGLASHKRDNTPVRYRVPFITWEQYLRQSA